MKFSANFWNASLKTIVMVWFWLTFCELTLFFRPNTYWTLLRARHFVLQHRILAEKQKSSLLGTSFDYTKSCSFFWATIPLLPKPFKCLLFMIHTEPLWWQLKAMHILLFFNLRKCMTSRIGVLGQLSHWKSFFSSFPLDQDLFPPLISCHIIFYLSCHTACCAFRKATKPTPCYYACPI